MTIEFNPPDLEKLNSRMGMDQKATCSIDDESGTRVGVVTGDLTYLRHAAYFYDTMHPNYRLVIGLHPDGNVYDQTNSGEGIFPSQEEVRAGYKRLRNAISETRQKSPAGRRSILKELLKKRPGE